MNDHVLVGTPSGQIAGIESTGDGEVGIVFVSMSARHPDGRDADYLTWHTLDHRPEQHRLPSLRASLRLVSTPDCRSARAASDGRYDAVDHVMSYFFTDVSALDGFAQLSVALRDAGRTPYLLPLVERGVYRVQAKVAAPRVKIAGEVLPWYPARGVYLVVEEGDAGPISELLEVGGVAGGWRAGGLPVPEPHQSADTGDLQLAYLFLDDHPPTVAERLRPALDKRWSASSVRPLLAAPFHPVVAHEWARHLP